MTTAWLAGGTGLVGTELVRLLLTDDTFTTIVAVGRRTLSLSHPKLLEMKVDFAEARAFDGLAPPAIAFSCLGTTLAKAGSPEAFRAVDHDAVLAFATAARAKGARTFVHVSSIGADPRAWSLYARVKGEIEAAVAELGFESVSALRPSLLDGEREERRPFERVALSFTRALGPVLGKYRPTPVSAVARTMVALAKTAAKGSHVVEANAIV